MWLFGLAAPGVMLGAAALSAMGPSALAAQAQALSPTAVVERFHAGLLENMKAGKTLGFAGRRDRLAPIIKESFDIPTMARFSTGAAWAKLSDDDKNRIMAAFTDWTVASYAANFKAWDGESFVTKKETEDGKGNAIVETNLIPKGEAPVVFSYRLRKVNDQWRIVDIYLEGAISQLAMHRGEFAAAIANGGVDNLIKHMQDLTAQAEKTGA